MAPSAQSAENTSDDGSHELPDFTWDDDTIGRPGVSEQLDAYLKNRLSELNAPPTALKHLDTITTTLTDLNAHWYQKERLARVALIALSRLLQASRSPLCMSRVVVQRALQSVSELLESLSGSYEAAISLADPAWRGSRILRSAQAREAQRCLNGLVVCLKFCSIDLRCVIMDPNPYLFQTMDELLTALEKYDNFGVVAEVYEAYAPAKDRDFDNMSVPSDLDASWYDYPHGRFDHPVKDLDHGHDYCYGTTTRETKTHRRVIELFHPPSDAYDTMMAVKESLLARDAFIFQKSKIMESIACILDNTTSTPSDEPLPHQTQGSDWKPIDEDKADMLWQLYCDLYDHLEEHDKAFAVSTPWELDAGVDVESAEYQAEEDRLFFHCEKFFLSFRKYLEKIDEASDYLEEELLRYLKRQGYKYQKIMLAEGKIGPEDVYTGFERELSTDWEDSSDEKVDSQPASQKVEEPSVNDDQHRYSNSLTSEQNAAEIDAILAEVMSQTH